MVPCYIGGRVLPEGETRLPLTLAVAVNGTIRAVTQTIPIDGLRDCWAAMVPEHSFRAGENEIRVFVVESGAGQGTLHPMGSEHGNR
jgi:hypothetical protein